MRVELLLLVVSLLGAASLIGGHVLSTSSEVVEVKQGFIIAIFDEFTRLVVQLDFSLQQIYKSYGDNKEPAQQIYDQMKSLINNAPLASYPQRTLDIFTQLYAELFLSGVEQAATLIQSTFQPFNEILTNVTQVDLNGAYGDYFFDTLVSVIQDAVQQISGGSGSGGSGVGSIFEFGETALNFISQIGETDFFDELKPVVVQAAIHIEVAWNALIELFTPLVALIRSIWAEESELVKQLWTTLKANAGPYALPYFPLVLVQLRDLYDWFSFESLLGDDSFNLLEFIQTAYGFIVKVYLKLVPLVPQTLYLPQIWSNISDLADQLADQIGEDDPLAIIVPGWIEEVGNPLVEQFVADLQAIIDAAGRQ